MPLLYYWRGDNYRRDLDYGAGYHLNQGKHLMHEIDVGDSLWAFTRRRDGAYVLAAELVVHAKTLNPPGYRYGRYRLWGDLERSRYFQVAGQADITSLIRKLSVKSRGALLGRAFQGYAAVRKLTQQDHQLLAAYSKDLKVDPRARLLPEERLEAILISGNESAVEQLLREEPSGLAEQRMRYLTSQAIRRDPMLVAEMRNLYEGQCQICEWSPRASYGPDVCETHHIRWLSRGGEDDKSNMVLLCPNHHRAIHRCDAQFDWESFAFIFTKRAEPLTIRRHLIAA